MVRQVPNVTKKYSYLVTIMQLDLNCLLYFLNITKYQMVIFPINNSIFIFHLQSSKILVLVVFELRFWFLNVYFCLIYLSDPADQKENWSFLFWVFVVKRIYDYKSNHEMK